MKLVADTTLDRRKAGPATKLGQDGKTRFGACIDNACTHGKYTLVTGWTIGSESPSAQLFYKFNGTRPAKFYAVKLFSRPDLVRAYSTPAHAALGFVALIQHQDHPEGDAISIVFAPEESTTLEAFKYELGTDPETFLSLCELLKPHLGFIVHQTFDDPHCVEALLPTLPKVERKSVSAAGHIEQARCFPSMGGLLVGWIVGLPGVRFFIVSEDGLCVELSDAARWQRDDIDKAYAGNFGRDNEHPGFVQGWHHPVALGTTVKLIAADDNSVSVLTEHSWTPASYDPIGFMQWAFEIPTPIERFSQRIKRHDGPLVLKLTQEKVKRSSQVNPDIYEFGEQPPEPTCSVIVPLLNRYSFVFNQLLEFAADEALRNRIELVYVLDDDKILSPLLRDASYLLQANRLPFRVVSARGYRGFPGISNLGGRLTNAPRMLYLNSETIPIAMGWFERMNSTLDADPRIGILGTRTLYVNGSVQSNGMDLQWDPQLNGFKPIPLAHGQEPSTADLGDKLNCQILSPSCFLIERKTFDAIGGFNEQLFWPDFAVSDLCLKVRHAGLQVACQTTTSMVSVGTARDWVVGSPRFVSACERLSSIIHQEHWGQSIASLIEARK